MIESAAVPLLAVEGLSVRFRSLHGDVSVLEDFSLHVTPGETIALVGESGCGKSVALRAVLRLLPAEAAVTARLATFEGRDLLRCDEAELGTIRGAGAAYLFQDPGAAFDPLLRVGKQIEEAVRIHEPALSRRELRARAVEALRECAVPEPEYRADRYPHELSGGLKQRALLAMALAPRPLLLVADEPTTALDATVQAELLALLAAFPRVRGGGLVLVSHDMAVVAALADRVMVLYAGRIVEEGPAAQLFAKPLHPYTEALRAAVRDLEEDAPRTRALAALPGTVPQAGEFLEGCRFRPRCPRAQPQCATAVPPLAVHGARRVACFFPAEGDA